MTDRLAHALAALLHEHSNLFTLRLAIDDSGHRGTRDMRRPAYERSVVARDEQHAVERDGITGRLGSAVDGDDRPWLDSHLPPTAVNDRVHELSFLELPPAAHRLSGTIPQGTTPATSL